MEPAGEFYHHEMSATDEETMAGADKTPGLTHYSREIPDGTFASMATANSKVSMVSTFNLSGSTHYSPVDDDTSMQRGIQLHRLPALSKPSCEPPLHLVY